MNYEDPFSGVRTSRFSLSRPRDTWSYAYARFGSSGSKEDRSHPDAKTAESGKDKKNAGGILWSPGIDGIYDLTDPALAYDPDAADPTAGLVPYTYDPTNGIDSRGDIWRVHVPPSVYRDAAAAMPATGDWRTTESELLRRQVDSWAVGRAPFSAIGSRDPPLDRPGEPNRAPPSDPEP